MNTTPTAERPRRRRSRAAVAGAAGLCAIAATSLFFHAAPSPGATAPRPQAVPPAWAKVLKGDLVSHVQVSGTLGYADPQKIVNQLPGTVTQLPAAGTTIDRGAPLYLVDNQPVILLYGATPAWRPFTPGMSKGPDVQQLQQNLAALGYTGFTTSGIYDGATASAVRRWEKSEGLPAAKTIELGRILFVPEPLRVTGTEVALGSRVSPGTPVLDVSGSLLQVTADIPSVDQGLVAKGAKTEVQLTDNRTTPGTVTAVGPATKAPDGTSHNTVTINLTAPQDVAGLQPGDVTVQLQHTEAADALSVPVTALLAQPGGGYDVQLREDGQISEVAVVTGAFAGDQVQISGPGIHEGSEVGVPAE